MASRSGLLRVLFLVSLCAHVVCTTTSGDESDPSNCSCSCDVIVNPSDVTEIQQEIRQELSVDKKSLSAQQRKKTSAVDSRVSAQSMGYMGVLFLSIVSLALLLSDILNVFQPRGPVHRERVKL